MHVVEAIKTEHEILAVSMLLEKFGGQDMRDTWDIGINVCLRIGDLLSIQYDCVDLERRQLVIIEQKTSKRRIIRLNPKVMDIINRRRNQYPDDIWLFQSHGNRAKNLHQPINRSSVGRIFQEVGKTLQLSLGTHSLRKTRGYAMHQTGYKIEQICRVLNHSHPAETLRYIGITQEDTLQTYDDIVL